jgi:hypothetical protein
MHVLVDMGCQRSQKRSAVKGGPVEIGRGSPGLRFYEIVRFAHSARPTETSHEL